VRVVLDVNVLIAALLSPVGPPAQLVRLWLGGAFELIHSPHLIEELTTALTYPRLATRVPSTEATAFVALIVDRGIGVEDPAAHPPLRAADPKDDYLLALASWAGALLVTGDGALLDLADRAPIHTPAEFLDMIG
jgi:putative PIN family toxin of toxin-antitoxin system